MTVRRVPRVGDHVSVIYLAGPLGGVIEAVSDDLHEIVVLTNDGSRVTFSLNPATARFTAVSDQSGARIIFGSDHTETADSSSDE